MATTKNTTSTQWFMPKEAFVFIEGARAPVPQTVIVRDRHSGKLAEVPLAPLEAPLLDEGSEGTTYVLAKGDKYPGDHPAVLARPAYFVPCSPP